MYRLFVAVDPPESIRTQLVEICGGLPGAKWFDPSQMHITLKFIGEVDGADLRDAREALLSIALDPFDLAVHGTGYFPPRGNPQTLWAGMDLSEPLTHLRNKVESTLVRAGMKPEHRKFKPHIQLAKVKDTPPQKVALWLREFALFRLPVFTVSEFYLYSSKLGAERAVHQVEAAYPLLSKTSEVS